MTRTWCDDYSMLRWSKWGLRHPLRLLVLLVWVVSAQVWPQIIGRAERVGPEANGQTEGCLHECPPRSWSMTGLSSRQLVRRVQWTCSDRFETPVSSSRGARPSRYVHFDDQPPRCQALGAVSSSKTSVQLYQRGVSDDPVAPAAVTWGVSPTGSGWPNRRPRPVGGLNRLAHQRRGGGLSGESPVAWCVHVVTVGRSHASADIAKTVSCRPTLWFSEALGRRKGDAEKGLFWPTMWRIRWCTVGSSGAAGRWPNWLFRF